jgi:hypothetical protein
MSKVKKLTKKDNFTEIRNILAREGYAEYAAVMDHELDLLAKKNASGTGKMTATQVANEGIKSDILEGMANEPNRMFTVSEMQKVIPCCSELSNQRISALLRQLVAEGKVERTEEKRKAYFSYIG